MKYEIGNEVEVIIRKAYCKLIKGTRTIITEYGKNYYGKGYKLKGGGEVIYQDDELKLITPNPSFKVGNEVEVTFCVEEWFKNRCGIIVAIGGDDCDIEFDCFGKKIKRTINIKYLQLITPKPFTKDDLKDGMICILRNGEVTAVIQDKIVFYTNGSGGNFLKSYNYNLEYERYKDKNPHHDIMQVSFNGEVIWERKEKPNYHKQLMKLEDCFTVYRTRVRTNKEYFNQKLAKESLDKAKQVIDDFYNEVKEDVK
jgi:hypothetical protein